MPQLIIGETAEGRKKPIRVTDDGELVTSGSGLTDSDGNALPVGFLNWPESVDESDPADIVVTKSRGGVSYVQHITIVGSVTTESEWVLQ